MLIMGFVGQAIGQWFPIDQLAKFSVRFKAMTKPGERISVAGRIVDETEERWICEAEAVNEDGEVKVSAAFEVRNKDIHSSAFNKFRILLIYYIYLEI